jgi:S-adenosylmethionine decarboxylase
LTGIGGYDLLVPIVISHAFGEAALVDAFGCRPEVLCSTDRLTTVFERLVRELELHPLAETAWHVFPGAGGVTGLLLLSESHLACHTFPESGFATFDLYCCRPRPPWPWKERLAEALGASEVLVRVLRRGER